MSELLNAELIREHLTAVSLKHLANLEILQTIDSTNAYLLNKVSVASGTVCLAEQQTAGRGRRHKYWHSPFGKNIYLSLCWHFNNINELNGLSIAIGVSVANALLQYGLPAVHLKWPNDVLYQNQKLCGILVEIKRESNGDYRAIIGVGINVDMAKENKSINQAWTDIVTITQNPAKRNLLVSHLLNELISSLLIFNVKGLIPFLPQWQNHDILFNKSVLIYQHEKPLEGIAIGIDENGNLLVNFSGTIKTVFSGEVSVRLGS